METQPTLKLINEKLTSNSPVRGGSRVCLAKLFPCTANRGSKHWQSPAWPGQYGKVG